MKRKNTILDIIQNHEKNIDSRKSIKYNNINLKLKSQF